MTAKQRTFASVLVGALAFAAASFASISEAEACGGFFCNQNQPVNQADENIVFTENADGTVTALIQIVYQGPAEEFAWVLPVPGEPEVDVSSATVFQRLTTATNPRYNVDRTVEGECKQRDRLAAPGAGGDVAAAPAEGADAGASDSVEVVDSGAVGPYRFTTISVAEDADDPAQDALDWLENNNYDLTDIGPELISEYLEDDMNLVAFKLQKNSESGDVRPVKLTYEHPLPMIPLKLTAVAAQDDMGVRVWVGGEHRAVPTRFKGVELNPAAVNWFNWQRGYDQLITEAADESGGRAFHTEYAGDSDVAENNIFGPGAKDRWEQFTEGTGSSEWESRQGELLFETIRTYARWDGMLRVIRQQVPLPDDVTAQQFANRPFEYIDGSTSNIEGFDPAAYLDSLEKNVIEPVRSAEELVQSRPYLTRLYTTVSADEMTKDPTFGFNRDLPDVDRTRTAKMTIYCSSEVTRREAPWEMELPDGTVVNGQGRNWPFDPSGQAGTEVTAIKKVNDYDMSGPPEVVDDKSEEIAEAVSEHNDEYGDPSITTDDDMGPQSTETNGGGETRSYACSSGGTGSPLGGFAMLLALLGLVRLRRRRA